MQAGDCLVRSTVIRSYSVSISRGRDETAAKQRDTFTATAGQEADCPEYIKIQSSPVYQKHLAIPVNISLHLSRVK